MEQRHYWVSRDPRLWSVISGLTLLGAVFAVWIAHSLRFVDCANEAWSECSTPGLVQLVVAWVGLIPAVTMLVQSLRGRGRPWRWLVVAALVYAVWIWLAWASVTGPLSGEP